MPLTAVQLIDYTMVYID